MSDLLDFVIERCTCSSLFLFTLPGVRTREIEPWSEVGEIWRQLGSTIKRSSYSKAESASCRQLASMLPWRHKYPSFRM
jgi:hypothetical protein